MFKRAISLGLVLCVLAACRRPLRSQPFNSEGAAIRSAAESGLRPGRTQQIVDLTLLAIGDSPDEQEVAKWARSLESGERALSDYVDQLLADPRFAGSIAPSVILRSLMTDAETLTGFGFILKTAQKEGKTVHYLRQPCASADAQSVHPWWAPQESVLVCPDSYRPERVFDKEREAYCGVGIMTNPELSDYCGCGASLIHCYRNDAQAISAAWSELKEAVGTIDYIVAHNLPIQQIFLSNETFRDRNAQIYQYRELLAAGQAQLVPDLQTWSWPEAGKWSPRVELKPGQHAGILTTPHLRYFTSASLRPRLKTYFDILWCKETDSLNVEAKDILRLGARDIRSGAGWEQLAAMPICTKCHARLDYGMQFLSGYPAAVTAAAFVPALQKSGSGRFYANDIKDLRGEAELSPQGFAQLAVAQPEFESCMVRDVVEHVWNDRATAADQEAVRDAFRNTASFKEMMRAALYRYAQTNPANRPAGAITRRAELAAAPNAERAAHADGGVRAGEVVVLSPGLRTTLEERCSNCHSDGERPFSVADRLPVAMARQVLSQVAFGRMPKGKSLDARERRRFVEQLINAIWTEPASRQEALDYFVGHALSVHRLSSILRSIHSRAGDGGGSFSVYAPDLVESVIRPEVARYTPGLAATIGLEAVQACKPGAAGDALKLRRCVEDATRPQHVIKELPRTSK